MSMLARPAAAMLAALALLLVSAVCDAAAAGQTRLYTVSFRAQPSGALRSTSGPDGRVIADHSYRDNGRGPDIPEEARFAADGRLLEYRTGGSSAFGAPLSESFTRRDGNTSWTSTSIVAARRCAGALEA